MIRIAVKTTVFLDRDGTINVNLPFPNVNSPEKMELLPNAAKGIRKLNEIGCRVVVVTNQAGINNLSNDLSWEKFEAVSERLRKLLCDSGDARIDDQFCCPHTPEEKCECRKPGIGLFEAAKRRYDDIDFPQSFIVGDRPDDINAGKKLCMTTILVRTGHGRATVHETGVEPDYIVDDLYQAALEISTLLGGGKRED